jgi:GNAT superfamily N-acetyltransferase
VQLVPASRYSIDVLTEAYNQTRIDYLVPMPMTAKRLEEYIQSYDVYLESSVVALDDDGEMLGLCMLGLREGRAWITRLGVLPTLRRHGAGQVMVEHCLEEASRYGASMVYLEVIVGNAPAHTLFLRLGFREGRKLLVLRRPPGPPPSDPIPPPASVTPQTPEEMLVRAHSRPWRSAWTNQVESMANVGNIEGLHLAEYASEASGWISFQRTPLQLRYVMIGPDEGTKVAPAYNLLYQLHTRFPALDTIAENVPTHIPHLDAYWAHGYVQSFARVEMELQLNGASSPSHSTEY